MRRLIVRRQAEFELNKAAIWYENRKQGLGRDLLVEAREMIQVIRQRPESFPIDYRIARHALLNRFPYAIHFVVKDELISVIAILHKSQDKEQQLRDRL
jgi:toxin ParE1/3/4